jgi:hypothetical protein
MGFSIQDYLKNNKIEMGNIKKEVGDTPYKGGHNDIRKTNYEVKIKADGKLDLYTHRTIVTESKNLLKEASEISFNELISNQQKQVLAFEKFFNGKRQTIWEGIHGYIVDIKIPMGRNRLEASDLKNLSNMKFRWIEFDNQTVSIGF